MQLQRFFSGRIEYFETDECYNIVFHVDSVQIWFVILLGALGTSIFL